MTQNIVDSFQKDNYMIIIEDKDIEYIRATADFAREQEINLRSFVSPIQALNFLYRTRVNPQFVLVDYFLPDMTGDVFIKQALKRVTSKFILYSISGEHILNALGNVPIYGVIKKQGIKHFIRTLKFYLLQDKQPYVELFNGYVLLNNLNILYLQKDPNVFITLTKSEAKFLSTFRPLSGIPMVKGVFSKVASVSTVMRLNKKLNKYNIPFKISIRQVGYFLISNINRSIS